MEPVRAVFCFFGLWSLDFPQHCKKIFYQWECQLVDTSEWCMLIQHPSLGTLVPPSERLLVLQWLHRPSMEKRKQKMFVNVHWYLMIFFHLHRLSHIFEDFHRLGGGMGGGWHGRQHGQHGQHAARHRYARPSKRENIGTIWKYRYENSRLETPMYK